MQLVINTYGSYLQKNGDCFKVKNGDQVAEVSAKKISSIMITTAAYITTDAIKLAMDNNIDIIFLDDFGEPFGRVWHSKLGSTALIRRKQLAIAETEEGLRLAVSCMTRKLDNQIELLTRLRTTRTNKSAEITAYIEKLRGAKQALEGLNGTIDDKRGTIMRREVQTTEDRHLIPNRH
jgi:CRISPR-associated protein Cas1